MDSTDSGGEAFLMLILPMFDLYHHIWFPEHSQDVIPDVQPCVSTNYNWCGSKAEQIERKYKNMGGKRR